MTLTRKPFYRFMGRDWLAKHDIEAITMAVWTVPIVTCLDNDGRRDQVTPRNWPDWDMRVKI